LVLLYDSSRRFSPQPVFSIYGITQIPRPIEGVRGERFTLRVWFGVTESARVWIQVYNTEVDEVWWEQDVGSGGWTIDLEVTLNQNVTGDFALNVRGGVVENGVPYIHATQSITIKVGPTEWTHRLILYIWKLPYATKEQVKAIIESSLIPTINAFEFFMGYDFIGYTLDWDNDVIILYYRQRFVSFSVMSFAPPLAAIALAIFGILIAVGIIIMGLAWYQREQRIATEQKTLEDWVEEGKITPEEYVEYRELFEKNPPAWYQAIPQTIQYLVYGAIAIGIVSLVVTLIRR